MLRQWVQVGGCLIQDEQRGVLEQHPRNGETLPFPTRKSQSLLAYPRLQTSGELLDEPGELRLLQGLPDLAVAGARSCQQQVPAYRAVEEVGILGHDPDEAPQIAEPIPATILAIQAQGAVRRVPEAQGQPGHGRLARSAGANHGRPAARRHAQADPLQDLACGSRIGEVHLVELQERPACPSWRMLAR